MGYELNTSLSKSISGEIVNLSTDLGKMTIEALAGDDSLLAKIPFISTTMAVYKMGKSVSEMHHLRQLNSFVLSLHEETASDETREEYLRNFLKKDEKERSKELEYIILITSKYLSEEKPKYLARLYICYVEGKIKWEQFVTFSEMLDRFLPGDIYELAWGEKTKVADNYVSDSLLRLVALGLMTPVSYEGITEGNTSSYSERFGKKDYRLTSTGSLLKNCLAIPSDELYQKMWDDLSDSFAERTSSREKDEQLLRKTKEHK